ncbi:hypothetical protein A9Q89_03660 [Gammaproteobacteria bacterium 53_120_T64]|nr:hypothetical protein A9Q89_03660 [Gammaproteobacteria bacterium 53_120_T64]
MALQLFFSVIQIEPAPFERAMTGVLTSFRKSSLLKKLLACLIQLRTVIGQYFAISSAQHSFRQFY